tara:strand:- start:388 stop:723 length:336 start_codon:yes stop_codon:yes gene_type:complete
MKLRKKKVRYQDGGSVYGKRHDRLRRRGHKLRDRADDQPVTEKGEKKHMKLEERAQKKLDKAKRIRKRKMAEQARVAQGKANIDAAVRKAMQAAPPLHEAKTLPSKGTKNN